MGSQTSDDPTKGTGDRVAAAAPKSRGEGALTISIATPMRKPWIARPQEPVQVAHNALPDPDPGQQLSCTVRA